MKNLINYKKFFESSLSLRDLRQPSVNRNGFLRGDDLIQKLQNGTLELIPAQGGNEINIENSDEIIAGISDGGNPPRYSPINAENYLKYNRIFNNLYSLNSIQKTKYFGSSGGSSLGLEKTRQYESILVYVFAYKQHHSKFRNLKSFEKLNPIRLNEEINRICTINNPPRRVTAFSPIQITPILFNSPEMKIYWNTFYKTANKFIGRYHEDPILNPEKEYNFYQIGYRNPDSLYYLINKAYISCFKRDQKSQIIPQGKRPKPEKWNPSDIWAVNIKKEYEIKRSIRRFLNNGSLIDLGDMLNHYFDDRDLVGISAKKLGTGDILLIIENEGIENHEYALENFELSPDEYTKDVSLILRKISNNKKIKIGIHDKNGGDNITAEIVDKKSKHGGCSLIKINEILTNYEMENVPLKYDYENVSIRALKMNVEDLQDFLEEVYNPDFLEPTKNIEREGDRYKIKIRNIPPPQIEWRTETNEEFKNRLVSKIQGLEFIKILFENKYSNNNVNQVINEMMKYILAIENEYFQCPKYIRVEEN